MVIKKSTKEKTPRGYGNGEDRNRRHRLMGMIRRHYGHLFDEHQAIHDVLGRGEAGRLAGLAHLAGSCAMSRPPYSTREERDGRHPAASAGACPVPGTVQIGQMGQRSPSSPERGADRWTVSLAK